MPEMKPSKSKRLSASPSAVSMRKHRAKLREEKLVKELKQVEFAKDRTFKIYQENILIGQIKILCIGNAYATFVNYVKPGFRIELTAITDFQTMNKIIADRLEAPHFA